LHALKVRHQFWLLITAAKHIAATVCNCHVSPNVDCIFSSQISVSLEAMSMMSFIALGKMRVQLKQMPNPARGQTDTIPLYLLNRRRGRSPWTNQESEMRSLNALSSSERACGMEHERGLRRIIEAIRRELRYRRDFRHLESMTEYELHDIGLSRSQIGHAVRRGR
jgi:uncharacterized protein YjiS (DUF1127 family)